MQADDVQALRDRLALKEQEVALLLAIDRVRDTLPEPLALLGAITRVLADTVPADLCALALRHQDAGHLELKTIYERNPQVRQWQAILTSTLMERASQLTEVAVWSSEPEGHLAVVPIIISTAERLGVLLLARQQSSFSPHDVTLLKTAETQIDSAVIQGYAYHDLQQHLKELETIYRIAQDHPQAAHALIMTIRAAAARLLAHPALGRPGRVLVQKQGTFLGMPPLPSPSGRGGSRPNA